MSKYAGYIMTAVISLGVGALAAWAGFNAANKELLETGRDFALFSECESVVVDNGTGQFNESEAMEAALDAYLRTGGDRYTYYYKDAKTDPVGTATEYVNSSGTALASGFLIDISEDGNILLTEVKEELAAFRQGLREGDIITEIDGVSVSETGYENIANKLLGKQDTTVKLKYRRDGAESELTFVRDHEYINDVESEKIGELGYIRIKSFGEFAAGQFSEAMTELEDVEGYIIDLRENSGGMTEMAVQMADYFVGAAEVTMHSYNGDDMIYETNSSEKDIARKTVVLVNGETASAAEMMTSLLMQYGADVTVIGEKTFGKGIYQQEYKLENGGVLHFTSGYYTVGDRDCYDGVGISPDIEIAMDSSLIGKDEDIQLQKALEQF